MLCLSHPFFKFAFLPELPYHKVEAVGQFSDLIFSFSNQLLVKISPRYHPCRLYDLFNRTGISFCHVDDEEYADPKDKAGGGDPLKESFPHKSRKILGIDRQVDVSVVLLSGNDGDDDVIRMALSGDWFAQLCLEDEFLLLCRQPFSNVF